MFFRIVQAPDQRLSSTFLFCSQVKCYVVVICSSYLYIYYSKFEKDQTFIFVCSIFY